MKPLRQTQPTTGGCADYCAARDPPAGDRNTAGNFEKRKGRAEVLDDDEELA